MLYKVTHRAVVGRRAHPLQVLPDGGRARHGDDLAHLRRRGVLARQRRRRAGHVCRAVLAADRADRLQVAGRSDGSAPPLRSQAGRAQAHGPAAARSAGQAICRAAGLRARWAECCCRCSCSGSMDAARAPARAARSFLARQLCACCWRASCWSACLFFKALSAPKMPGAVASDEYEAESSASSSPTCCSAHRQAHARAGADPGGFGLGQVSVAAQAGRHHHRCGLLLHRLRPRGAPEGRPGRQPVAGARLPGQQGRGVPQRLGGAHPARTPRIARPSRSLRNARGALEEVPWQTALETFCSRFKGIQQTPRRGLGRVHQHRADLRPKRWRCSARSPSSAWACVHGDGNTRQCMATSVVAYKQAFGFDAPPYTYDDFEQSDVLVFVGANPCIAHPIMWERVCKNPHQPEIIVIDPRKTETAMAATQHLPLRPKSRSAAALRHRQPADRARLRRSRVRRRARQRLRRVRGARRAASRWRDVAMDSGSASEGIERLVETIGRGKRVSFWWTMGVNQSHEGVRVAQAIINIALITGNIGRPGTGANSITGQCNAMGSRLFSNTTEPAGRPRLRERRAPRQGGVGCWASTSRHSARRAAWLTTRSWKGVLHGKIKGLWIVATNTAHSWINQSDAHEMLETLDFLVVQDMYTTTETARARAIWCCRRRAGARRRAPSSTPSAASACSRRCRARPGEALADFYIFKLHRRRLGRGRHARAFESPGAHVSAAQAPRAGNPATSPASRLRHDRRPARHPVAAARRARRRRAGSERRLFEDGQFFHADGTRQAAVRGAAPAARAADERYPLILLLTGRGSSSQWHTQTRTGKSAVLRKLYPEESLRRGQPGRRAPLQV